MAHFEFSNIKKTTMNKIRKYLIHLLGGVTEEESDLAIKYAIGKTGASASKCVLLYMKNCYGLRPDEWCKKVYDYVHKTHERAEKELAAFLDKNTSGK